MYLIISIFALLIAFLIAVIKPEYRKLLIIVNVIICVIYTIWRFTVIPIHHGIVSFILGVSLYSAEILGLISFLNFQYLFSKNYKLENKSLDEVVNIAKNVIENSRFIFAPETLDYLKKGGRITPAVALLAGMLKIVPVMELNYDLGGKIDTLAKVRTLSKAKATLVDRMKELGVNAKDYKITIEHVLCEASALDVKQMILDKIGYAEIELRELPAVVGAHMGVGGLGVQYIKKYE